MWNSLVTAVKTAPLFSNQTQNDGRISVIPRHLADFYYSAQLHLRATASRAHARGYSAVFLSLLFFMQPPGSSTEPSTRLLPLRLPHPRSGAIVSPTSAFQHTQASLLPLTRRAKGSLQRTLYNAYPPGLGDIHLHPPVISRPLRWVFSNTFQHGALD
jgi:hypothetical protein